MYFIGELNGTLQMEKAHYFLSSLHSCQKNEHEP